MPPSVSINLCCYNSEKYLRETLDSVVNQTYNDWELVIINDGSTDSTETIIREYSSRGYPIIYYRQENHGLGYSRNKALELSNGKYIAFIDHDDTWLPEKLEKQISWLEKNPEVGIVFSNAVMFNQLTGREWLHGKRGAYHRGMIFSKLLTDYFLPLLTVIIRKQCLDDMSEWFDVRFNIAEEADLFTRIAHNWRVDFVPEPLARCRVHSESLTWSRADLLSRELKMMLDKYRTLYENFEIRYRKELNKAEAKIAYYEAVQEWKNNASAGDVRRMIFPHMAYFPKLFAFYFMTFFPYTYFIKTMKLLNKHP